MVSVLKRGAAGSAEPQPRFVHRRTPEGGPRRGCARRRCRNSLHQVVGRQLAIPQIEPRVDVAELDLQIVLKVVP